MEETTHHITTQWTVPNIDDLLPGLNQATLEHLSKKGRRELRVAKVQLGLAVITGTWLIVTIVKEFRNN